jgi:flagellar basal-body rod protein FlgF
MSGGMYVALSGMRARTAQLDRVAADIANVGTSGYKSERTSSVPAERPFFQGALDSAVDVANGPAKVDFTPGTLTSTGRDLDCAIDGRGFFVLQTPAGPRYTRNGHFTRSASGELAADDGSFVLGQNDARIPVGDGKVVVEADGSVKVNGTLAGRLRVVDFADTTGLTREQAERFAGPALAEARESTAEVRGGAIEGSNVSTMERVAQMTQISRSFEALNRGISVLMNELDGRAISELGRR